MWSNFSTNFLISANWVYFSKLDLMVPFNKNGLQVSPNNTRVKRRLINSEWILNTSSNHTNGKKFLCSGATSIWRNACLISAISPIFPVQKRNKILNKSGSKHCPGSKTSFRNFSFLNLTEASKTIRILLVSRLLRMTGGVGDNERNLYLGYWKLFVWFPLVSILSK